MGCGVWGVVQTPRMAFGVWCLVFGVLRFGVGGWGLGFGVGGEQLELPEDRTDHPDLVVPLSYAVELVFGDWCLMFRVQGSRFNV